MASTNASDWSYSEDTYGFFPGNSLPTNVDEYSDVGFSNVEAPAPATDAAPDGDSVSAPYSVANSSAFPFDPNVETRSLGPLEKALTREKVARKPEDVAPPVVEETKSVDVPTKRGARVWIVLSLLCSIAVISAGVAVYLSLFYLVDENPQAQIPGSYPGNGPTASPTNAPTTASTNLRTSPPTAAATTAAPHPPTASPTESPTSSPTSSPTQSPTYSSEGLLRKYFEETLSIEFTEDMDDPMNLAVAHLFAEDSEILSHLDDDDQIVQRFAMLSIGLSLELENSFNSSAAGGEWLDGDECDGWAGVVCVNTTVSKIVLGNQGLTGSIPSTIGLLTNLIELDLSQNSLIGGIPSSLYRLTSLEKLYLYQNQLTGQLSEKISNWEVMTHLHLSQNALTGSVPFALAAGNSFYYVNLFSNSFSGSLPADLGWENLWYLDLGHNKMSGELPSAMESLTSLQHLFLDHNSFSSTIPVIGNPATLQSLELDNNEFTGAFPMSETVLEDIVTLTVHNNSLTENIEASFCKTLDSTLGGTMVEFTADCDVCKCKDTFCTEC